MGRPVLIPIPSMALKLLFGEMAEILLEGQRVVPQTLIEDKFNFKFIDLEMALREISTD